MNALCGELVILYNNETTCLLKEIQIYEIFKVSNE